MDIVQLWVGRLRWIFVLLHFELAPYKQLCATNEWNTEEVWASGDPCFQDVVCRLRTTPNSGRGACFWKSLSQHLCGSARSWRALKEKALSGHADGTWADQTAIQVAAEGLGVDICIVQSDSNSMGIIKGRTILFQYGQEHARMVHILLCNQHFEAAYGVSIYKTGSPRPWAIAPYTHLEFTSARDIGECRLDAQATLQATGVQAFSYP